MASRAPSRAPSENVPSRVPSRALSAIAEQDDAGVRSDEEIDKLANESGGEGNQYGGGPNKKSRKMSATPPANPPTTRLRRHISITPRAKKAGVLAAVAESRAQQTPTRASGSDTPNLSDEIEALVLPGGSAPGGIDHPIRSTSSHTTHQPSRARSNTHTSHASRNLPMSDASHLSRPPSVASDDVFGDPAIDKLIHLVDETSLELPSTNPRTSGSNTVPQTGVSEEDDLADDLEPANGVNRMQKSKKSMGRPRTDRQEAIEAVCRQVDDIFEAKAKEWGIEPSQIFAYFKQRESRVQHSDNSWNTYQRYFKAYRDEELRRLPKEKESCRLSWFQCPCAEYAIDFIDLRHANEL